MAEIGLFLSSEEHGGRELVETARRGEAAGFRSVWVSDHFHPWLPEQGQSPFVWSVIGGIASSTDLRVTTAVSCPIIRIHPVVLAQAAATAAEMLQGRFCFGIGTGELLNEHVLGDKWPEPSIRLEMLEESVELMRRLWTGESVSHHGRYFTAENARIHTRPDEPPPVPVSAFGPKALALAARIGDGFITTAPSGDDLASYREQGGEGPSMAGVKVCWGPDERAAAELAHERWRSSGLPGQLAADLPTTEHFAQATQLVTVDQVAEKFACGPDPEVHASKIRPYLEAGFDEVYISQIGDDQQGFLDFYTRELAPRLQ